MFLLGFLIGFVGLGVLLIFLGFVVRLYPYPLVFRSGGGSGFNNYGSSGGGWSTTSGGGGTQYVLPGSKAFERKVAYIRSKEKIVKGYMHKRSVVDRLDFAELEKNNFKGHEYLIGWDETGVKPERESKE